MRTWAIADLVLKVTTSGTIAGHTLMCAMGLDRIPMTIDAALSRGEWGDIIAKARGMRFAENLFRYPIVRQACGCRVCAEMFGLQRPLGAEVALLVVRVCPRHLWHPLPGAEFSTTHQIDETILVLGELRDRA